MSRDHFQYQDETSAKYIITTAYAVSIYDFTSKLPVKNDGKCKVLYVHNHEHYHKTPEVH
jgi:hypothetical protein